MSVLHCNLARPDFPKYNLGKTAPAVQEPMRGGAGAAAAGSGSPARPDVAHLGARDQAARSVPHCGEHAHARDGVRVSPPTLTHLRRRPTSPPPPPRHPWSTSHQTPFDVRVTPFDRPTTDNIQASATPSYSARFPTEARAPVGKSPRGGPSAAGWRQEAGGDGADAAAERRRQQAIGERIISVPSVWHLGAVDCTRSVLSERRVERCQSAHVGSAPARLLCLVKARLAAPGSSALPEWGPATRARAATA